MGTICLSNWVVAKKLLSTTAQVQFELLAVTWPSVELNPAPIYLQSTAFLVVISDLNGFLSLLFLCKSQLGIQLGSPLATLSAQLHLGRPFSAWDPASILAKSSWRDLLFLLMSISFGGLGLMSLRNPFAELVGAVLGKTDLRSMFCLVVCFIIVFVLGQSFPTHHAPRCRLRHKIPLNSHFAFQHTSPIHPRTLSVLISRNNPFVNTSAALMTTPTTIIRPRTMPIQLTQPGAVLSPRPTLFRSTIPHLSILLTGHQYRFELPNTYFIALASSPSLRWYLWRGLLAEMNVMV